MASGTPNGGVEVPLESGETGSVAFTEAFDEVGEDAIEVAGTAGGTFTVVAPSLESSSR